MLKNPVKRRLKVLLIEDVKSDAELVKLALSDFDRPCQFEVCSTQKRYLELLDSFSPDIILSDFSMPGFNGLKALELIRETDDLTPFIFVTGTLTEDNAVEAIRVGVTDFILKKNLDQLPASLLRAMREKSEKVGRREALDQLKTSQRRFECLVQEGSDLIGILDSDANYLFVSQSSEKILGLKPEEFIGKNAFDFIHPDDCAWVGKLFESIHRNKQVHIGPFRFTTAAQGWRWIETIATNTLDDPAVNGIIVNSRDITERIEREEALKLSNERYRMASLATKDLIYDWELTNSQVTRMGDGITRLFGYTPEDLQSDPQFWQDNVHPEDRERVYRELQTALADPTENYCEQEYRFLTANGSYADVNDRGYIIRDEKGKALRLVGALQDITEQKSLQAQKELIGILRQELGKPGSFERSLKNLLKLILGKVDVELAEIWITSIDDNNINLISHYSAVKDFGNFYQSARSKFSFEPGQGLPGKVWSTKQIQYWQNISSHKDFNRSKEAKKAGLKAAYGAPILYSGNVIGVLVFFGSKEQQNLASMSSIMRAIGTQLGSDIQRKKVEERLHNFFELSTDLLCIAGNDGYLKKVNPAFSKTLGYSEEELLTTPFHKLNHPSHRDKARKELLSLQTGAHSHNVETRHLTADKKEIWVSWSATPLPEQKLIFAVGKDITEKKKTEQAVEKLLSQLKTAQQIAQIGYWTHDFKSKNVHWSEEMYLIWEQDPVKWKPTFQNLKLTVHRDDQHKLLGLNLPLEKEPSSLIKEYRIQTPTGKTKWISEIITLYRDGGGKPWKMDGVAQDITSRKNLELLYREIGRLARVGAWELDLVHQTLFWSTITKELHEVQPDYSPSLDVAINFYKAGKSRDTIANSVNNAIKNGTHFDEELQIVTAKGNERWVRAIGKPEFLNGACVRVVGSFQDIHARKLAEEENKEILESITDGFFAVDKNWKVVYWNSAASQMLGATTSEKIVGQDLWTQVPLLKNTNFFHQAFSALETQNPEVTVEEFRTRKRWFQISLFPKSGGLSVYFKDITKETEQQRQILKIKNNLDTTINSANDLIFSVDANMRLISANRAFKERIKHGFNEEIKEGHPVDIRSADLSVADKWRKHFERALAGEQFTVTEEDILQNRHYYSLVSFNPFMENGVCIGTACFVKDITERTIHLNAIEEQNQRLKDIAWMQSHVVRAPVARIMGLVDLVSIEKNREEISKLLNYIEVSAKELDEIIREITKKTKEIDPMGPEPALALNNKNK